jgi:tRNA nucleotidyltransferase (CCA-adding enzyme)
MQVYLVGGAIRDQLLGIPVRERDWVVVGARPEDLEKLGYLPVGREFPVFLHPKTKEEYALARLESKVAPGYRGFTTRFSPDVTLQEDLRRRDLTINAIAQSVSGGELIDPYGGAEDLKNGILRHVSEAFVEDPVRVLRVARFAARFGDRGFSVAPETRALMQEMVRNGEIDALVPERVWQETERALGETRPELFFLNLRDCGALQVIFPEIAALFGVPQPERWHPEIDTGLHVMLALQCAVRLGAGTPVRFAVLMHDLGKAATPPNLWPSHHGHEEAGVALIEALAARLRVPKEHTELAVLTARHHGLVHRALELKPATILGLLEKADAWRRRERFRAMLLACEADARGRAGLEERAYPQADLLREAQDATAAVSLLEEDRQGLVGTAIKEKLREKRLEVLTSLVTRSRELSKAKATDPEA